MRRTRRRTLLLLLLLLWRVSGDEAERLDRHEYLVAEDAKVRLATVVATVQTVAVGMMQLLKLPMLLLLVE